MRKIKVPDGMYQAALKYQDSDIQCSAALKAALRWLSENPIVPTDRQLMACKSAATLSGMANLNYPFFLEEWQRRMFLAPDEDEPIADLLLKSTPHGWMRDNFNALIQEAYKRGKEDK